MQLRMATKNELKQFYTEEYDEKEVPEYITCNIQRREFACNRVGKGPRDRYHQFTQTRYLERVLKAKRPYLDTPQ